MQNKLAFSTTRLFGSELVCGFSRKNVIDFSRRFRHSILTKMQPDDLSVSRGDSKIKEKLNLHVKKRLQETGKSSAKVPAAEATAACPPGVAPSPRSKTKKAKTNHLNSTSSTTLPPAVISISNIPGCSTSSGGGGTSATMNAKPELLLSPGATGGNSNDTTNSSFNSVDLDPDANVSNDGQERTGGGEKGTKVTPKPDIFTVILNEKKSSLMRDPEVISFLRDLVDKRNKS